MRFLLSNLLSRGEELLTLRNIWQYVPDTHDDQQCRYISDAASAFSLLPYQFAKTHDPSFSFYRNKQVIYLVRDGRDVLSSFYHYQKARGKSVFTLSSLIQWNKNISMGTWSDHAYGWANARCRRKLIIRYDALLKDPEQEVQKLLDFLNWKIDLLVVQKAIQNSSFKNLQEIEDKYGSRYQKKSDTEQDSRFFRKGEAGDWKATFSPEEIDAFWKHNAPGMRVFNFE